MNLHAQRDPNYWKRIDALLEVALSLPSGERNGWLGRLAHEQSQFEPLLRIMLQHAAVETDTFMAKPVSLSTMEAAARSLNSDRPGDDVGPYRLVSELGRGGMATVWLADRVDGILQRQVALKLPRTVWGMAQVERMQRERDILASLEHPNIARLYDAGITKDGRPFLAMEKVDGQSIDRYCRKHDLSIDARLRLFLQVARAVSHAHAGLVVHRDLKPNNILVDAKGNAILLDFGVAKLLVNPLEKQSNLTQQSGRVLTPDYASPEQIRGGPITVGSDVYSLGVVLYELLTEKRPYQLTRNTPAALEEAVVEANPPLASGQVLPDKKRSRLLRGDIDTILAKTLKKNVNERYQSVEELAADIKRHLLGEPVLAQPDSFIYRADKFVRRNLAAMAITLLVAAIVAGGLVGTMSQANRAEKQATQAELERNRAIEELTFAEASEEFMRFLLSEESTKAFTTKQLLERAEILVDERFVNDAPLRARMQLLVADLYGEIDDYERAAVMLERAKNAARQAATPSLITQVDCTEAGRLSAIGKIQESKALFAKAMADIDAGTDVGANVALRCFSQRTILNRNLGNAKEAMADAEAALRLIGAPRPGQRSAVIIFRGAVADANAVMGNHASAVDIYEETLAELVKTGRARTAEAQGVVNNLIAVLVWAGQLQRAAAVYERELHNNPTIGIVNEQPFQLYYARILIKTGHYAEGIPLIVKVLAAVEKSGNERAIAHVRLAASAEYLVFGDVEKANQLLTDAMPLLQRVLPPKHATFAVAEVINANIMLKKANLVSAEQSLVHAISMFQAASTPNLMLVRALSLLARTEQLAGHDVRAREHAANAVDMARAALHGFTTSEWLGSALLAQAVVYNAQGDVVAARAILQDARAQLEASAGADAPSTKEANALFALIAKQQ